MAPTTTHNETGDKKISENQRSVDEVVYPEIEPGIITKDLIEHAYLEDGLKGEAARLHKMEPVVYDRITTIRLEFKNILRIDHLWMMPNLTKLSLNCNKIEAIEHLDMLVALKELDLSFNYIEKIEKLDKLVNLEVLTLFNNLITTIENLDALENLVILSLGNNHIKSTNGIERFRFFKSLRVLNLQGNPIAHNVEEPLELYVAAVLPNLLYYEYVTIKPEVREKAKERFFREIREIEGNEEVELLQRARVLKEKLDAERLSLSFVEHLNEHQLYQSLWKSDEDGRILLLVGPATTDLVEAYDNDVYDITQVIYKLGLEKHEERQLEIAKFRQGLEDGTVKVQLMGQRILEEFLLVKDTVFEEATTCLRDLELRNMRGEDEESPESLELADEFDQITIDFDDTVNTVWQQLMAQELHLHESIEEATVNFQRIIQEMMSKFIEQSQAYFGQIRDVAMHFSDNLNDVVSDYISEKLALQNFSDVPEDLMQCMEDRDALASLIAGMKDTHVSVIDDRDDRLVVRSRNFIEEMISKVNSDELDRNRAKILEINTFLELMTDSLANLQGEIREELLNQEA